MTTTFRSDYGAAYEMTEDQKQVMSEAHDFGITIGSFVVEKAHEVFSDSAARALLTGKDDVFSMIAGGSVPATMFIAACTPPAMTVCGVTMAQNLFAKTMPDGSAWTREQAVAGAVRDVMAWVTAMVDAMTSADIPEQFTTNYAANHRAETPASCDKFALEVRKAVAAKLGVTFAPQKLNSK